jgi:heme-binding protein
MRRIFQILIVLFVLALVVIQFFQPEENSGEIDSNHILKSEPLPEEISSLLANACLDCHSNQTNYLWYHQVAPVSWFINGHITEGKSELNLSDWGTWDPIDKISALDDMATEVKNGKMPIKSYVLMHRKAKLSEEQKASLVAWTESFSERILTGE